MNGVNTSKILFLIYMIAGVMTGINGVLTAARLNSAGPTMGPASAFNNNIICALLLGGKRMGRKRKHYRDGLRKHPDGVDQ